jgi:hypothetical protein
MLLTCLIRYDKSGTMEPGEDRMVDMYHNFCQGTHTDPIDRPKAAIFLLAAFGIGFANANIPQWWHRLLPPQARCILGQEGHESPTATVPRVTNSARARSRSDAQHQAFWDTVPRQIMDSFGGGGSAYDVPQSRAPVTASVSALDCVSVLNALQGSELTRAEKRAREAAVSRLCLILEVPARQRQRDDESDGEH